jgi:N-acetyl-gamma-glutamyl-phosphate reductase
MSKTRVAIVGASGYSGEELVRLLSRHPRCEITAVTSRQSAGKPIGDVFPRFADSPLKFIAPDTPSLCGLCDAAFLALPHGLAAEFAEPLVKAGKVVFDISADFRIHDAAVYKEFYKDDHPAPGLLPQAVYGSPERHREALKKANLVACAGCYPTSIILPAAPLLKAGLVSAEGIIVSSMSGVSGAGRKVDLPYLFPECNESLRAYSPVGHRHLPEIEQELAIAAGVPSLKINFTPHLVPVNRGICSAIFLTPKSGKFVPPEEIAAVYADAYKGEPFVRVLPSGKLPDTKHVTLTNTCEIGFCSDKRTGKIIVSSVIDNLTKGAAGQAVQCMNIRMGFPETEGLL